MTGRYVDISVPISEEMLVWPGDPGVRIARHRHQAGEAAVVTARLELGSHTGTHVDAPPHFCAGDLTVDLLSPEALIGPAQVVDLRGHLAIGAAELEAAGAGRLPRVLLKTDNSTWVRSGPMPDQPAHLTAAGASYLVERNVRLVGVDGLSVDLPGRREAHMILLRAGVVLLETLDLSLVEAGEYRLVCLPLRILGGEAAPARAVLAVA